MLLTVWSSPNASSKTGAAAAAENANVSFSSLATRKWDQPCGGPAQRDTRCKSGPSVSAARLGQTVVASCAGATSTATTSPERSGRGGSTVGDRWRGLLRLGLTSGRDRLHDQPNLVFPGCLRQDCRVPQHAVVESILCLRKSEKVKK